MTGEGPVCFSGANGTLILQRLFLKCLDPSGLLLNLVDRLRKIIQVMENKRHSFLFYAPFQRICNGVKSFGADRKPKGSMPSKYTQSCHCIPNHFLSAGQTGMRR